MFPPPLPRIGIPWEFRDHHHHHHHHHPPPCHIAFRINIKGGKFKIKNQTQGSLSEEGRKGGWGRSGAAWPQAPDVTPWLSDSPSQHRRARLAARPASAQVGAGAGFLLLPRSIPPASKRPWLCLGRSRRRQAGGEAAVPGPASGLKAPGFSLQGALRRRPKARGAGTDPRSPALRVWGAQHGRAGRARERGRGPHGGRARLRGAAPAPALPGDSLGDAGRVPSSSFRLSGPAFPSLRPPPRSGAAAASSAVMSAPAESPHPAASARIPPKLGGAAASGAAAPAGLGPAPHQQNGEAGGPRRARGLALAG